MSRQQPAWTTNTPPEHSFAANALTVKCLNPDGDRLHLGDKEAGGAAQYKAGDVGDAPPVRRRQPQPHLEASKLFN